MFKRLFFAINLPEKTKKEISFFQEEIKKSLERGVKWVEEENLHITMAFLGSVREEKVSSVISLASEIKKAPFEVLLNEITYIPKDRRRAKMIWIKGESLPLVSLREKLEKKLEASSVISYIPDKREFTPHVTLCRMRSFEWQRLSLLRIPLLEEFEVDIRFSVPSFELMESKISGRGPVYRTIESFPLKKNC